MYAHPVSSNALEEIASSLSLKLPYTKEYILNFHIHIAFYDIFIISIIEDYYARRPREKDIIEYIRKYIKQEDYNNTIYSEIFQNYCKSIEATSLEIKEHFPKIDITKIELLGDRHDREIVKFKYGQDVYFRNVLKIEPLLKIIYDIFPSFQFCLPIAQPASDNHDNVFYKRKYIELADNLPNLDNYYYLLGQTYYIVLLLKSIDVVYDNLLISSEGIPQLFDLDFVTSPNYKKEYGPLTAGLIDDSKTNNISPILGGFYEVKNILRPIIIHAESDKYFLQWILPATGKRIISFPPAQNSHPYLYYDSFRKGYELAVSFVDQHKLNKLKQAIQDLNHNTRVIARRTSMYRYIQMHGMYRSEIKQYKSLKDFFLNELRKSPVAAEDKFDLETLTESEASTMLRFNYPYFYTNFKGRDIFSTSGEIVGKLPHSPYEDYLEHLDNLKSNTDKYLEEIAKILKSTYRTNKDKTHLFPDS